LTSKTKIIGEVEITPEEVRNFKTIPKKNYWGREMEVAQIVVTPKVSDAEKQKSIDKLNQFKINEGIKFRD
jgi:peptidyl-prolyl cis-trans isomerase SurA